MDSTRREVVLLKYYKTLSDDGKVTRLDTAEKPVSGEEITRPEFQCTKAAIAIFRNGMTVEEVREKSWMQ